MKSISSVDIHFLIREFQELIGAKVNNIYSHSNKDITVDLYGSQKGKISLVIRDCKYLYTSQTKELSDTPGSLCTVLRQKLKNATLTMIEQVGGERIVHLIFEKTQTFHFYVELFARGNIILCTAEGKIVAVAESLQTKERAIRYGTEYTAPKNICNFKTLTAPELIRLVEQNDDIIVKTLATVLGLGGVYAEEICLRASLDKNTRKISEKQAEKICAELKHLLAAPIDAHIVRKNGVVVDVIPVPLLQYTQCAQDTHPTQHSQDTQSAQYDLERVGSFAGAFAQLLAVKRQEYIEHKKIKKFDDLILKVEQRIHDQKEHIAEQEKIASDNQKKGDLFFTHYADMQQLISWVKENRKKLPFEELKKELHKNKRIRKVTQRGEIVLDLAQ